MSNKTNSVWHSPNEEPQPSPANSDGYVKEEYAIELLVITKSDGIKQMYSTHEQEFDGDEEGYWIFHESYGECYDYNPFDGEILAWAYTKDIIPANLEEAINQKTFDFSEALKRMKEGKLVNRKNKHISYGIDEEGIFYHHAHHIHKVERMFSDDILATDWEEVET